MLRPRDRIAELPWIDYGRLQRFAAGRKSGAIWEQITGKAGQFECQLSHAHKEISLYNLSLSCSYNNNKKDCRTIILNSVSVVFVKVWKLEILANKNFKTNILVSHS